MSEAPLDLSRAHLRKETPLGSPHDGHSFTEMCSGSEAGSYLRLIDVCITQLKAQGPYRTCDESKEEEEERTCGKRRRAARRTRGRQPRAAREACQDSCM